MATIAYDVLVRRIATGSDFRIRLFSKDAATACDRAMDRARFAYGIRKMDYHRLTTQEGIAVFRIVSVEVSPNQHRGEG